MFEDALFATNHRSSPQTRWAAAMSFAVQAGLVTVLVALPLFFTEALPLNYVRSIVDMPSPPPAARPPADPAPTVHRQAVVTTVYEDGRVTFHPPAKGPIKHFVDDPGSGQQNLGPGVIGGTGMGDIGNGVINDIIGDARHYVASAPPLTKPVAISHIDEGLLLRRVTPVYPPIAMMAHQQGAVVLHAIIGRDGLIQQLQAVGGPPLLIKAAMDAVAQWRYRPYVLNGQPVEVETQITVNFKLGG